MFGWLFKKKQKTTKRGPYNKAPKKLLTIGTRLDDQTALILDCSFQKSSGERDAILASSGMGKSYLTGVLIEETMGAGQPVCVIDPEGEYWTMAALAKNKGQQWQYPVLIVGGEYAHAPLVEGLIPVYLEQMLMHGFSIVFDMSEHSDDVQKQFYSIILEALFMLENRYKRKSLLIVDEAAVYAPQAQGGDALVASEKIAKRGRKRAIDSLWATQRSASVNKNVLSQCNRFWFGGLKAAQDYEAIKHFVEPTGIGFDHLKSLKSGQFYLAIDNQACLLQVRKRYLPHGGGSDILNVSLPPVSPIVESVLSDLKDVIDTKVSEQQQNEADGKADPSAQKIKVLEAKNQTLEQKIQTLEKQLEKEAFIQDVEDRLGISSIARPTGSRRRKVQVLE